MHSEISLIRGKQTILETTNHAIITCIIAKSEKHKLSPIWASDHLLAKLQENNESKGVLHAWNSNLVFLISRTKYSRLWNKNNSFFSWHALGIEYKYINTYLSWLHFFVCLCLWLYEVKTYRYRNSKG